MTREDKQSVISICRILADKMDDSGKIAVKHVISAVERMKEQEQNLDAINRKTAIKTINSWLSCDDYNEAEREIMRAARSMLLGLPSVTPNQKQERITDDAISRQAVLDAIGRVGICKCSTNEIEAVSECTRAVKALPPVTAEPKTGHWIETAEDYYKAINEYGGGVNEDTPYFTDDCACSVCLARFSVIDNETERFDYCPNCGAQMVEPQESEEQT